MPIIKFKRPLLLASASPARRQLLADTGLVFKTCVVAIDESSLDGEEIASYCERLACAKAKAATPRSLNSIVIGVDTAIGFQGSIIGKPKDEGHARQILKRLSGKTHDVVSAIALLDVESGKIFTEAVRTEVDFASLSDDMIDWYISTGEWIDRAGAYAIQGKGAALIASVRGCFTNVIGLSIPKLLAMLQGI